MKPPTPKYSDTWDVTPVLEEMKKWWTMESLSLEKLTLKLTMLLALGTGFRVQNPEYTGNSTRHAPTSKAKENWLNINIIKKAEGAWSDNSTVFMKFYNRPIVNIKENFAYKVCNNNINNV
ncbi:hypothetical protein TKK_0006103 [Trichogramma kaykai]